MECPRCKTQRLVPRALTEGGVATEANGCGRCQGLFFSRGALDAISEVPRDKAPDTERLPDAHVQLVPLSCPSCADPMVKVQSRRQPAVTMDVCSSCAGIWLDDGELAAIQGTEDTLFRQARRFFRERA